MDAGEDAPAGLAGAAAPGQSSCGTRPGSAPAGTASSRSGGGGGRWFGLCAGGERSGAPRAQGAGREMPWEPLFAGRTRGASAALGRSGLLLPQPAHGCSGVKSCSSLHRLAAARLNAGEVTAMARWVPGSALAPVLGRQRGDARQGEHHRGQRESGGGHHARCREPPATRGPADRPGTEASAPARRRRARSSIRAAGGDVALATLLRVTGKRMLGHSQETVQVLRQLERLSPLLWGSGRSAATGISRSGSSQARPKEEGPKRPSGWLSRGVASLTLTSVPQPGTVMDFVSASGILAAVQSQWDTFPQYCHATKTFASRSGSRRVGTTSLKITSPLPIGLDYLLC